MTTNVAGDSPVTGISSQPENINIISVVKDEELRLLDDVVRSFPPEAVKNLLSLGVCPQCILRLFGKHGPSYSRSSSVLSLFSAFAELEPSSDDLSSPRSPTKDSVCKICYGILQFIYVDEKQALVKKECANDLAVSISELTKQEGHQADGFSLEVSVPASVVENENAVRLFMKEKHGSEVWFQEMLKCEAISVKDALKLSIVKPLETLFDVKPGSSSFRIRLTYTSSELPTKTKNGKDSTQACKRRKTDFDNGKGTGNDCDVSNTETDVVMKKCSNKRQEENLFDSSRPLDGKVSACCLAILCHRTPIYIGGRYLKYSRNVSQTRWIIDDERMGEASIEEIIGGSILPLCRGDNYKFHAAGREDIDVRMLGSGRPFLLEIQNPRVVPSEVSVKEMEMKINEGKLVKVKNLKGVSDQGWTLMREGEAEKQKQYTALVWISRHLEDNDLQTVLSLKDVKVLQRTPVRVLHRRSPLEREKIIHWMNIEKIAGSTQYFLLHLCTQAGTYIKEFVHGDLGRTTPSIGSILGCRAEILQLDVTDVKMDCFLPE